MAHLVAAEGLYRGSPPVPPPPLPSGEPGSLLTALGSAAGELLKARSTPSGRPETIGVFEATTGGMIQASLQAVPGASRYYHGGANIYGSMGFKLYPLELRKRLEAGGAHRGAVDRGTNYASRENYHKSKMLHTAAIATHMRDYMGAAWCIAESGATGPTFAPEDMTCAFSCVTIVGPDGLEEVAIFETDHSDRETAMWQFTAAALHLLERCIAKANMNDVTPSGSKL